MGRKKTPGLIRRGEIWHIDKQIKGYGRLCESTGARKLAEAEVILAHRIESIRQAVVFGIRPTRTFREAATRYLNEYVHKRSIGRDALDLETVDPFIGDIALNRVHDGTLQKFIRHRLQHDRVAVGTVNRTLSVVRRVLSLSARKWRDEQGLTWLETMPLIELLPDHGRRRPYPLSWEEQRLLFSELSPHLARMALFKVNTGTREQEVARLQWDWEIQIPELNSSVFVVPRELVKNNEDRLIVLNRVAQSVIDDVRHHHPTWVFTYSGGPVKRIGNAGWQRARKRAAKRYEAELGSPCPDGFRRFRVHDLKHTYGRRLRAAGVSLEDRQDLLGHKSGKITTEYSAPELANLIEASNKVCGEKSRKTPALTLIRTARSIVSR
jgi:integrase